MKPQEDQNPLGKVEVVLSKDRKRIAKPGPFAKAWHWLENFIFGPTTANELDIEERRLLHGIRKAVFALAALLFLASVCSFWHFAFEEFGRPDAWDDNMYAWLAYMGRIAASVLVMLLTLNGLFKLVTHEKQPDPSQAPFEVAKQLKSMAEKTLSQEP